MTTTETTTVREFTFKRNSAGMHLNHLLCALECAKFGQSKDSSRPILTSVLAEVFAEGVRFVSTDSYRLVWSYIGTVPTDGTEPEFSVLLNDPKASLVKFLKDWQKDCYELTAEFSTSGLKLTATDYDRTASTAVRDLEGTFPNWSGLVPTDLKGDIPEGIGFNPAFVADIGKIGALVQKHHDLENTPVKFQCVDRLKPSVWSIGPVSYLLMPVRIG